jgi:hypothetical protein
VLKNCLISYIAYTPVLSVPFCFRIVLTTEKHEKRFTKTIITGNIFIFL